MIGHQLHIMRQIGIPSAPIGHLKVLVKVIPHFSTVSSLSGGVYYINESVLPAPVLSD